MLHHWAFVASRLDPDWAKSFLYIRKNKSADVGHCVQQQELYYISVSLYN